MSDEDWGCPDWQIASSYPRDGDALSTQEWKWQFLRRNPEYRQLWLAVGTDSEVTGHEAAKWIESFLEEASFPEERLAQVVALVQKRIPPTTKFRLVRDPKINEVLMNSFGVGSLITDPRIEKIRPRDRRINGTLINGRSSWLPDIGEILNTLEQCQSGESISNTAETLLLRWPLLGFLKSHTLGLVAFDLTKSIDPQVKKAARLLQREQDSLAIEIEQLKANQRSNWPRHLRVIDAKDQGAEHEEIYEQFASEQTQDDEEAMDEFYRPGKQPKQRVSQWLSSARDVMAKASRLL